MASSKLPQLTDNLLLGFLNIRKPGGMTSHDVVGRVRRILRIKHVGHGGTLDPMAEGVMTVAVGSACRLLRFVPGNKTYKADILFGTRTTTDDIEGEVLTKTDEGIPDETSVRETLTKFVGALDQIPPAYSAVHHEGKRLYQLARQGIQVADIPSRRVFVDSIDLLNFSNSVATVRITCGAGTYIRSIARDIGDIFGCGGCLSALLREQSGPFHLDQSVTLQQLEELARAGKINDCLVSPNTVLAANDNLTEVALDETIAKRISLGQKVPLNETGIDAGVLAQQSAVDLAGGAEQGAAQSEPGHGDGAESEAASGPKILATCGDWLLAICRIDGHLLRAEVVIKRA